MDLVEAPPCIAVLCLSGDDTDAFQDVDYVVDAAALDTQGVSRAVQANDLVLDPTVLLNEAAKELGKHKRLAWGEREGEGRAGCSEGI